MPTFGQNLMILQVKEFTYAERAFFVHRFATLALQKYVGKPLKTMDMRGFFESKSSVILASSQKAMLQADVDKAVKGLEALEIKLTVANQLSRNQGIDIVAETLGRSVSLPANYVFTLQTLTAEEETFPVEDHSEIF